MRPASGRTKRIDGRTQAGDGREETEQEGAGTTILPLLGQSSTQPGKLNVSLSDFIQ